MLVVCYRQVDKVAVTGSCPHSVAGGEQQAEESAASSSATEPGWSKRTKTVVKRAQQHLFPLRRLKRFGMFLQVLKMFYSCTIENILTGCITAWYGNCSASDRKALEGSAAQYITGAKVPGIQEFLNLFLLCHYVVL